MPLPPSGFYSLGPQNRADTVESLTRGSLLQTEYRHCALQLRYNVLGRFNFPHCLVHLCLRPGLCLHGHHQSDAASCTQRTRTTHMSTSKLDTPVSRSTLHGTRQPSPWHPPGAVPAHLRIYQPCTRAHVLCQERGARSDGAAPHRFDHKSYIRPSRKTFRGPLVVWKWAAIGARSDQTGRRI